MELLTVRMDEETLNAFKHFDDWVSIGDIAKALKFAPPTAEKICWTLAGKGLALWKPGKRRKQLFKYNQRYGKKKGIDIFNKLDELLGRDYYITGETALFLYNLTDHAMYQRIKEIAIPKNKYTELAEKIVEKLNKYATFLPDKIPNHCNKRNMVADALGIGDVVILRKALNNPRKLKFYGDLNLPGIDVILTELDLPDKKLFEYTLKAIDFNLTDEEFKKLCLIKPTLRYLKKYLEGDKNIPNNILNVIQGAEKNARGY